MAARLQQAPEDRIKAALLVAAIIGPLGWGLVSALAGDTRRVSADSLQLFTIQPPSSRPVQRPRPEPAHRHRSNGKAAHANLHSAATPVVAPQLPPRPPLLVAAPKPGIGLDPSEGTNNRPGPGTGSGGQGNGTGSGDAGNGAGESDGDGPELIRGAITDRDYPRGALAAGASGTVLTRFTVGVDGRVSDCVVPRSSGNAELGDATCRLIVKRFRFRPTRGGRGRRRAAVDDERTECR